MFQIYRQSAQHKVLFLHGNLNYAAANSFPCMMPSDEEHPQTLLIDLSGIENVSAAGLRALLHLYRNASGCFSEVYLVGLTEEIYDVLQLTGFIEHFAILESYAAA